MKQSKFTVIENRSLTETVMKMRLCGDTSALTAPGQFVNIKLDGLFLRRPISVCDYTADELTLLYKVVGAGTEQMARLPVGSVLDILSGLGNGFQLQKCGSHPVLIGGGIGIPPLYRLCRELIAKGLPVTVILGFNTAKEVFYKDEFEALGATVFVATADGSAGTRGLVTDVLKTIDYDYFYTCGPMPMFRAIEAIATSSGQYSFEERMGCGFGACMGCSCKTKYGTKRICRDGPVLEREEIIW